MTEIPPYLFLVTSTALVLGAAITIRGLLGFRPLAADTATSIATTPHTSAATETADPTAPADATPTASPAYQVRDLREPIVMTIAGVLICSFTLLAIAALIHSA